MSPRLVFVRAINVGGTAALPMAALRELLADLGASEVRTYIQSGNAIVTLADEADPAAFERAVEDEVERRFGFRREVMSRTPDEVRAAIAAHPFPVADESFSFVSFLTAEPTAAAVDAAARVRTGDDRWAVVGRDLHLRYERGVAAATLRQEALTAALGVAGTARNLRTLAKLLTLVEAAA